MPRPELARVSRAPLPPARDGQTHLPLPLLGNEHAADSSSFLEECDAAAADLDSGSGAGFLRGQLDSGADLEVWDTLENVLKLHNSRV